MGHYQAVFGVDQYKAIRGYPRVSRVQNRFVMTYFSYKGSFTFTVIPFFSGSLPSGVWSLVRFLEVFSLGADCLRLFCWFVFLLSGQQWRDQKEFRKGCLEVVIEEGKVRNHLPVHLCHKLDLGHKVVLEGTNLTVVFCVSYAV